MTIAHGDLVTFGLLTAALAALWLPLARSPEHASGTALRIEPWMMLFLLAVVSGLVFGQLDWRALVAIGVTGVLSWGVFQERLATGLRVVCGAGVVAAAASLGLHLVPGFDNPKVISDLVLTPGAVPYSKYLNFDKAIVGLFLLSFGAPLISARREWLRMLRRTLPVTGATVVIVLILSFLLGYVRFEPEWPPLFPLWGWTNLFFTCMAEEAIFRGFVQRGLERQLEDHQYGALVALLVASVLFGLAHWAGGPKYIVLSTVAGLGYGLAMQRSGRIEGSILTHFTLNSLHYLFFTYPALSSAVS